MSEHSTTLAAMSMGYFACWRISKSVSDIEFGWVDGQMEGSRRPQHMCVISSVTCSTVLQLRFVELVIRQRQCSFSRQACFLSLSRCSCNVIPAWFGSSRNEHVTPVVIIMMFCQCTMLLPTKSARLCYFRKRCSLTHTATCGSQILIDFHAHTCFSVFV